MNLCAMGATRDGGADGKVIIERLCIFLPYVKTFNSKVIKGFIPELRSRYVFFMFRDSYVLCIYVMNILCTFPIFMYGYVTTFPLMIEQTHETWINRLLVFIIIFHQFYTCSFIIALNTFYAKYN